MNTLIESGILTEKQAEGDPIGPMKLKFNAEGIMTAIYNSGSFDNNYLTYVDFLDCLVRVAYIYPFTDQEKIHISSMDQKLSYLVDKLNEKYGGYESTYLEYVAKKQQEMNYQPRIVVDDEVDEDFDDE